MTYNIFTKALEILRSRTDYYDKEAEKADYYTYKEKLASTANAYQSAWWILYYAINENWEALEQFDCYKDEE